MDKNWIIMTKTRAVDTVENDSFDELWEMQKDVLRMFCINPYKEHLLGYHDGTVRYCSISDGLQYITIKTGADLVKFFSDEKLGFVDEQYGEWFKILM